MKDKQMKDLFQQTLNAELSGLRTSSLQRDQLYQNAVGGYKVKRKLTVGWVFALVLLLMTVTAVAAIMLSGKDFVNLFLAPMSSQTREDRWTEDELNQILALAEENGVEITDEIHAAMASDDPVYKEELLRLFMKIDLGFYPATWPLEEQAWYDELLVKYGLAEKRTRFLPADGEIGQEEALGIARQYMLAHWCVDVNQGEYTLYQQYMLSEDATGAPIKVWDIEHESEDGTVYVICLRPDGSVIEDEFSTYIHHPANQPIAEDNDLPDDIWELAALMRDDSFYTVDTLAHFRSNYAPMIESAGESKDTSVVMMQLLLDIPYAEPKATDISPEHALSTATDAAVSAGWTSDWLGRCRYSVSYRDYDDAAPVYRICFKLKQDQRELFYERQMPFGIVIYIDPTNGNVVSTTVLNELDEYDRYCEFPDPHDNYDSLGNG